MNYSKWKRNKRIVEIIFLIITLGFSTYGALQDHPIDDETGSISVISSLRGADIFLDDTPFFQSTLFGDIICPLIVGIILLMLQRTIKS